jgi:hypothetical protein
MEPTTPAAVHSNAISGACSHPARPANPAVAAHQPIVCIRAVIPKAQHSPPDIAIAPQLHQPTRSHPAASIAPVVAVAAM